MQFRKYSSLIPLSSSFSREYLMLYQSEVEKRSGREALAGQRLAFIGGGVMAEVMIAGALEKHLVESSQIFASHPRSKRADELAARHGIQVSTSNLEAAQAA